MNPKTVAAAIRRGRKEWPKMRVARGTLARTSWGGNAGVDQLIRLKRLKKQALGYNITSTCAAGFAVLGCMNLAPASVLFAEICPVKRCYQHGISIAHLNDSHRWTPEQIAAWLESL